MRVDIIKLVQYTQRGLCPRKNGIGVYNWIMRVILYAGILAVFGFHMMELYVLNTEVVNLKSVVVQEFIGPVMPSEIGRDVTKTGNSKVLNLESD